MKRRDFMGWLALTWPSAAIAQATMPVIGFLNPGTPNAYAGVVEAFRAGLKEAGYVEGRDVAIEYRWAEGDYEREPRLAAELVERKVAVIVAIGNAALPAKSATSTIPIVFVFGADPVSLGLVKSLNRPGGNVTGIINAGRSLDGKRIGLLHDLMPRATTIGYMVNPQAADAQSLVKNAQAAAGKSFHKVYVVGASSQGEIDSAFAELARNRVKALVVASESLYITQSEQIVALSARHAIAGCYPFRHFTAAGGLMSYGAAGDGNDGARQAAFYAVRILRGTQPGDLPVMQMNRFELVVNLKTAKKLGLNISRDFLARVDEVIQ